ncbi:MAG TPA: hypothetical protein VNW71_25565 [Thermoanaerobaculia bacterium]|nr:hypothetical protein [Thermoanaerobaculia bacterium]
MPRILRTFVCLGILSALIAALPGSASGQTTTTTTTTTTAIDPGFPEVTADLGARSFRQVLPFDVPFQIVGTAPEGVTKIGVQYAQSKEKIDAPVIAPPAGSLEEQCAAHGLKPTEAAPGVPWEPVPPAAWEKIGLVDTGAATTFRVTMQPLDALQYYAFRFDFKVDTTTEQANAFRAKAEPVLDEGMKQVRSGNLTPEQRKALRLNLIKALKQVVGEGDVIAPGTLFDPCTDDDVVREDFLQSFQAVMNQQRFRDISLGGIGGMQDDLRQNLEAVRSNAALDSLLASLQQRAAAEPAIANLLQGTNSQALALITMDAGQVTALAAGVAPQGTSKAGDLVTTWSPSTVDGFASNYQDTLNRLTALKSWLDDLIGPSSPNASVVAGLADGQLQALRALIGPGGAVELARQGADLLQSETGNIRDSLSGRQKAIQDLAGKYEEQVLREVTVDATTTGNGNTFQNYYISADLGFVYMPDITESVPYVGTNIYFRPVNKNAPLSQRGGFWRRFALTVGVTLDSIADDEMTRQDFSGSQSLVVGAGLRMTESIRLGFGALVFKKRDRSPLVDDVTTGVTPYVSVSFDWNVAKTFKGIGSTFFGSVQ